MSLSKFIAAFAGVYVILLGSSALFGWALHFPPFIPPSPDLPPDMLLPWQKPPPRESLAKKPEPPSQPAPRLGGMSELHRKRVATATTTLSTMAERYLVIRCAECGVHLRFEREAIIRAMGDVLPSAVMQELVWVTCKREGGCKALFLSEGTI